MPFFGQRFYDAVCPHCHGELIGDGFTTVVHCENADQESYWYSAPDEGPFYCDPTLSE